MSKKIVIIADHTQDGIQPATFGLLKAAVLLQAGSQAAIRVIIAGDSVQPAAEQLAAYTSCSVLGLELGGNGDYLEERVATALLNELESDRPEYICIHHTVRGVSLAATIAVGLNGACIPGVEDIVATDGSLFFRRSTHGGKFMATIATEAPTTILTIQPEAVQTTEATQAAEGQIEIKAVEPINPRLKLIEQKAAVTGAADLANAKVVIAAGQGIGESENLNLINRLATCFTDAAVAGSRIVCDLGWLDYNRQVGVSGNTVAPDLYFACGVSGATQHLAGMRGSKFVVAVNTDPNAAIFREADVCIVEDLTTFIPAFIAALERLGLQ